MIRSKGKKKGNIFGKKVGASQKELNPEKDWKVIVMFFFVTFLIIAGLSAFFFWQVRTGEVFRAEEKEEVYFERLDQERLDEVLEFFDDKQTRMETLLESDIFEEPVLIEEETLEEESLEDGDLEEEESGDEEEFDQEL